MNILLLGASGLIGHRVFIELGARSHDVHGLMLGSAGRFANTGLFNEKNTTAGIDLIDFDALLPVLEDKKPEVIINCCGITRRRPEIDNAVRSISVNAILPHKLADWAAETGARVVHLSTDCVFDGKLGNYDEDAQISGEDQYGRTKGLGELWYDHTLTLRTSFIGQELQHHSELLDWFLGQRGKTIHGFTRAMYSGFSTIQCARMIVDIIEDHPTLSGLYNLSMAQPVSKY
ncbi:MAG: SDR family oxidoreductase, partial [Pseudomonadota bacterium]